MEHLTDFFKFDSLAGHFGYALVFLSFIVKRMVFLRSFAILASLSSIYFNYNLSHDGKWIPINWNLLFISINSYHIMMHLLSLRKVDISGKDEKVYTKYFSNLTPVEFLRLLKVGHTRNYSPGSTLIEEGEELPVLFLLMEGEVSVHINGLQVAKLESGDFIGEMSFLTEQKTRAKVIVSKDSKIHFWDKEKLKSFLNKNPALLAKFHGAIGNQLINKLISKSVFEAEEKNKLHVA